MTIYTDTEASQHDGAPVYGYQFIGTFDTWRLTSSELAVTIDSQVYDTEEISHGAIRSGTQDDDNLDLEITLPMTHALVQAYAFGISPPKLNLTVYRVHQGTNFATDFAKIWVGRVTAYSITGKFAKLRVPSIFVIMLQNEIPNVYFQPPCNNVLYDERCKINPASHTVSTTVTVITDDHTIEVAADGFPDTDLRAGEVVNTTKQSERRTIVDNVGDVISFVYPFSNIEVGDSIDLIRGCDHAYASDCITVFANGINFSGVPFPPQSNPYDGEL